MPVEIFLADMLLLETMPKISVVIPFYNVESYIERCIQALLAQSIDADDFEIIMVDNNSTDQSAQIVAKYPEVRLLCESKQGSYAARNCGIAASVGELIAFTDSDCVPRDDWLSKIWDYMQTPDVEVLIGSRHIAVQNHDLSMLFDYENTKDAFVFASQQPEIYYGHTNNMAIRRSLFEIQGLFNEVYRGADTIFVRQVVDALSTDKVLYCADMIVEHLELETTEMYFHKVKAYARSRERNKRVRHTKPLSLLQRCKIYLKTIREHRYSIVDRIRLFALLTRGMSNWSIAGSLERFRSSKELP